MRDLVTAALAQELDPLGLRQNGDEFRRHTESGDGIVVAYREVDLRAGEFYVDVGLISVPWLEWVTHEEEPVPPEHATADHALGRVRVGLLPQGPPWVLRADNAEAVLAAMRAQVGQFVREYIPLLDRTVLIDKLLRGDNITGVINKRAGLLILLASRGIDHEFVERFSAMRTKAEWLDWIWNYALRNTPPGTAIPPRPTSG